MQHSYTRTYSLNVIMAMAGYQFNPGHEDLDDIQPMVVQLNKPNGSPWHFRCTLGDIRLAKQEVRNALQSTGTKGR